MSQTKNVPAKIRRETRVQEAINETIIHLRQKDRKEKTITEYKRHLRIINENCDIFNSSEVALYVLQMKGQREQELTKGYKRRIIETYAVFCKANLIPFDKPKIRYEPPIPLIPTTEQVQAIINNARPDKATIYTMMSETAIEPEELHSTPRTQINTEQGTISVKGTKGHANGTYKLKSRTADMLRNYLAKHTEEYPFPKAKTLGENWRNARARTCKKLCRKDLKAIPLKNLRNYAGAVFYKTTGKHDPIATMRFMRHKHLDTTLHYIRGINLDEPEEYKTVMVKLGEPDTIKKIEELSNAGYSFLTEADGYQAYRIHK